MRPEARRLARAGTLQTSVVSIPSDALFDCRTRPRLCQDAGRAGKERLEKVCCNRYFWLKPFYQLVVKVTSPVFEKPSSFSTVSVILSLNGFGGGWPRARSPSADLAVTSRLPSFRPELSAS